MFKNKRKTVALLAVALLLAFSLCSTSFAAGTSTPAQIVKIILNGQQVPTDINPIMQNGSVFVPIRMISTLFNKDVAWDNTLSAVKINDKAGETTKDAEIAALKKQVEELKSQLANKDMQIIILQNQLTASDDLMDIDDLEDQLNKDHDEYKDVEFDITLSGDEDDVTVTVDVDLDDFEDEWDDLTTSNKTSYLQGICDDILDAYEDADISGKIRDVSTSSKKTILTFTVSSSGKVSIDADELSDLEEDLDDYYCDYFDAIDLSIELEGDEDDITYFINVDYDEFEDEWDDLDDTDIKNLMKHIYQDIEDEYDDADITGYVFDTDAEENLAKYYQTSSGTEKFTRY